MKLILDVLRLKSQHGSEQERWIRTWKTLISLQNQKTHRPRSLRLGPGVCALLTPQVGLSMDPTGKVQSEARSQSAQSPKLEGYGALRSLWPGPCRVGAKGPGLLHTQLQARGCWLAWRSVPGFVSCDLKAVGSTLLFLVNNQKKKKKFPVWKLKAICFSFYFPSSLAFFHSPLSLPHPKNSQLSWEHSDLIWLSLL